MTARRYVPEPTRPLEMAESHWLLIQRLRPEAMTRVLERASLIHEACPGTSWEAADERALAEEVGVATQQRMGGVG